MNSTVIITEFGVTVDGRLVHHWISPWPKPMWTRPRVTER